jgi:tRNA-specific 2-thiouridylase
VSHASGEKIIVGLSGGVDSAVAALLLRRQGADVEGLFMANWDEPGDDDYCTTARDYQDARAVCAELGLVLHKIDFAVQYRQLVFAHFLDELRAGRTPNPDVLCNREIKFGVCLDYVRRLGGQRFATGHYACLRDGVDGAQLHKGVDSGKDQSYFLHAVPRAQLAAALFPLGEMHKSEVRALARSAGLPIYDKPDSTGICFIGERPFAQFLAQWLPRTPGPMVTPEGEVVGEHQGLAYYTLGQRGGLAIGGRAGHAESPWFVAAKDSERNRLVVVQGEDHRLLYSTACEVSAWNWLGSRPSISKGLGVKLRYRQADQELAHIEWRADRGRLTFAAPQRAVTPGQFAVLYAGSRCLGGGVIEHTEGLADVAMGDAIIRSGQSLSTIYSSISPPLEPT